MADFERIPVPPEGVDNRYSYQNPTAPLDNAQPTAQIDDVAAQPSYTPQDPFSPASKTGDLGGGTTPEANVYASEPFGSASVNSQPTTMKASGAKKKGGNGKTVLTSVISSAVTAALVSALMSFAPIGASGSGGQSVNATTGDVTISNNGDTTTAEAVAAKCLNSVVTIYVYSNSTSDWSQLFGGSSSNSSTPSALGSGVIVSENNGTYYIVTNYHVVEGISKAVVKVGNQQFDASSVGYDAKSDLAVISIKGEGLTVAEWGDSKALNIGEWVAAIGAPYGYEQTLTTGIISALYRSDTISSSSAMGSTVYTDMIQTDAAINPGNSGGGLFDAEGKLIGINTYISSTSQSSAGLGFAIPQANAQEIAEEIISGKTVEHAFLGVSMGNAGADGGVEVAAVYKDTAAAKAGLKTGDVITKVGDKSVSAAKDVSEAISSHKVGDKLNITYKRGGKENTVEVTLGSDSSASEEFAEGGEPATQNNENGNQRGNGGNNEENGNGGNGFGWGGSGNNDFYGFDLDELFGGNPFSFEYGNGNSGSGSDKGNSNGFWN